MLAYVAMQEDGRGWAVLGNSVEAGRIHGLAVRVDDGGHVGIIDLEHARRIYGAAAGSDAAGAIHGDLHGCAFRNGSTARIVAPPFHKVVVILLSNCPDVAC